MQSFRAAVIVFRNLGFARTLELCNSVLELLSNDSSLEVFARRPAIFNRLSNVISFAGFKNTGQHEIFSEGTLREAPTGVPAVLRKATCSASSRAVIGFFA